MAEQPLARDLDTCDHFEGLIGSIINNSVFVGGLPVAVVGDEALRDSLCDPDHPDAHCVPYPMTGSFKVYITGAPAHRNFDQRQCFALTEASQVKVFAG
jgi:uncharacterized Zn-binding protein involved in type VI secretion